MRKVVSKKENSGLQKILETSYFNLDNIQKNEFVPSDLAEHIDILRLIFEKVFNFYVDIKFLED